MTALVAMEGLSGALGHSALIIGFAASLFGAASLVSATTQGKRHLLRLVSGYGWVVGLAGLAAFVVMERALIVRDWSLAYVQKVGSYDTPVLFNITALWSALEGSILLWLLLLAAYTLVVLRRSRRRPPHRCTRPGRKGALPSAPAAWRCQAWERP